MHERYRSLYLSETARLADALDEQVAQASDPAVIHELFRLVHTLKGMNATMGIEPLRRLCHDLEQQLGLARDGRGDAPQRRLYLLVDLLRGVASGEMDPDAVVIPPALAAPEPPTPGSLDPLDDGSDPFAGLSLSDLTEEPSALDQTGLLEQADELVADLATGAGPEQDSEEALFLRGSLGDLLAARDLLQSVLTSDPRPELDDALTHLSRVARSLQQREARLRFTPARELLMPLRSMLRRAALERDRELEIELEGEEVQADRALLEALLEPVLHLATNALAHGIEAPVERRAVGKAEQGRIRLIVRRARDQLVVAVGDDGRGFDPERIRARALERGLVRRGRVEAMSDQEVLQLCFLPGFSTRQEADLLAGRGVGLYAARTAIELLKGTLSIDSRPGAGSLITARVPFSLTLDRLLMLRVGPEIVGLFASRVAAVRRLDGSPPDGARDLGALLGLSDTPPTLLVELHEGPALLVEGVLSVQEALVRPPVFPFRWSPSVAGTTTLGRDRVVFVLDPKELLSVPSGDPDAGR